MVMIVENDTSVSISEIDPEKIARPKVKDDFDLLDDDELENDMNITFEDIDTIDTDLIQEEE